MPSTLGKIYLGSTLVASGEGGGGTATQFVDDWVRNPAWPAIPTVLSSEQKIVGLYAVWPGDGTGNGANFFAFNGQGAYTINFGDGTTTNFPSNTQANYEFNFNNAALAGTNKPVTFTASTNTVNLTAHGFTAGTVIPFFNIVTTTGLIEGRRYYVVNPTANAFQVSATLGGAPVTLTGDGSAALLPYKVAIVTITPQAGQNLTVINLQVKHNQTGLPAYTTGWLDLAISVPNVTGASYTLGGTTVVHRVLERVNVIACGVLTSMANMYSTTPALRSVSAFPSGITEVTNLNSHYANSGLRNFPPFLGSAAKVQNTSSLFAGCFNADEFPPLPVSIAALTTANLMYSNTNAKRIPPFPSSTAGITNMNGMVTAMPNLQELPVINMAGAASGANGSLTSAQQSQSLKRMRISGMRFSFSLVNCQLSAVALNEIFDGLPVVTGQTITVTGNYGTSQSGYNPSIATAKGWTVTA
jgi:hypothetical protein